ncbi:TPA: hypothetical protein ACHKB2_003407 [Acinetobacter baumannii]
MKQDRSNLCDEKILFIHESLTPELISYLYPDTQHPIQHPFNRIFLLFKQWLISKLNRTGFVRDFFI